MEMNSELMKRVCRKVCIGGAINNENHLTHANVYFMRL